MNVALVILIAPFSDRDRECSMTRRTTARPAALKGRVHGELAEFQLTVHRDLAVGLPWSTNVHHRQAYRDVHAGLDAQYLHRPVPRSWDMATTRSCSARPASV